MKVFKSLFLPIFTIITLAFSMSPWFIGLMATPADRVFSGVNRWSADYYTYLSFVETGQRGHLREYHLTTTKPQEPIVIHGIYTVSGYLGKVVGLDAISVYHLDRLILGGVFISLLYLLYQSVFLSVFWTALALIFVFWLPGFPQTLDMFGRWDQRFLYEVQEANIVGRATTPPHYLLGFSLFVLTIWYFMMSILTSTELSPKHSPWGSHSVTLLRWLLRRRLGQAGLLEGGFVKKGVILSILATLVTIANPVNLLILLGTLMMYMGIKAMSKVKGQRSKVTLREQVIVVALMILGSIPIAWYYHAKLSIFPWGPRSNALKYYIPGSPLNTKELILALGPTLPLALVGIWWWIIKGKRQKAKGKSSKDNWWWLFFSWLVVQFGLLFWARNPSHGIDPLRFLQGLYYIPLAGFAVHGVKAISSKLKVESEKSLRIAKKNWAIIMMGFAFLITLPTLILSYREQLFMNTDYKTFATLIYPTKAQYQAYKFMEQNTPFASGVLAFYEVTEVLPAFSGNATERDISHSEKLAFFTNQLNQEQAYTYLKENGFSYVWYGYQEASVGFQPKRYPFLEKIFENKEVSVYHVIPT